MKEDLNLTGLKETKEMGSEYKDSYWTNEEE